MLRTAALGFWLLFAQGADLPKVLEKADALLEEAKTLYEDARARSAAPVFVEAGFKLEEARIKYLALNEVGSPEQQKTATDRLRAVNQLAKLIHDGKVAVSGAAVDSKPASAEKPGEAPAAPDRPAPAEGKPTAPIDVTRRAGVPDAAKQKDAEKAVHDLFKDQYAKKSAADRKAFARQLLDQAAKTGDDPAAAWVLYREAQDQAVQGFDPRTAIEAIDAAAKQFDIDPLPVKASALAAMAKVPRNPEESAALTDAYFRLIDEHVAADQYDAADKASAAALLAARRTNDPGQIARATTRAREIGEARTRFAALKGVLQTLASKPDDPAANLEMGQYLCYVKGSWDLGPRFLSKGSDPVLRALAEKELALPVQAADKATLADGWFDLAQKESSPLRKGQLLAHAGALYESALPDATGLLRVRIEKRMEGTRPQGPPAGPPGSSIDLLKLIDAKRDQVSGEWSMERGALIMPPGRSTAWLQVPYSPPEEYDLKIVAARKGGGFDLYAGVVVPGGKALMLHIDGGFNGRNGGFQTVNGKDWGDNETSYHDIKIFADERPHTILISVRKTALTVTADGKPLIKWTADYSRTTGNFVVPNQSALYVGNWEAVFEVTQLQLIPVSGWGKSIPHVR
ncbi:MAG: hypothetical protein JO332_06055 [Planctomycetaceae bacterium]|nr:hypothetical protein [Planctomycetaceae bacterium]